MSLDAHYLEVFKAVLAECSMSQAAGRLRTSASNVKRIVTLREGELGVPLFDRESRGKFLPTGHAERLSREIAGFMSEMESLQERVTDMRERGRILKIGAHRWFFETAYFVRLFNGFRQDARFRAAFLEVPAGQERTMVESGGCDIYVGVVVPGSKRLTTTHLPALPLSLGSIIPGFHAQDLALLADIMPWGLYAGDLRSATREWLQTIQSAGGGAGRQLTTPQYREWLSHPDQRAFRGMLCPQPASGTADPQIAWQEFPFLPGIPVRATFLAQHPYGCLENAIQKVGSTLKQHDHPV